MDFFIAFGAVALSICVLLRGVELEWGSVKAFEFACEVSCQAACLKRWRFAI